MWSRQETLKRPQLFSSKIDLYNKQKDWQQVYTNKNTNEVNWFHGTLTASLDIISELKLEKHSRIIDVGGGDGTLADQQMDRGFVDVTVLDISEIALIKAKARLGERSKQVKWIVADVATYKPEDTFDLWHDSAAFHFHTSETEIQEYVSNLSHFIKP